MKDITWNVAHCHERMNNIPRAYYFAAMSLGASMTIEGGEQETEQIRQYVNGLRDRVRSEQITLPPTIARFTGLGESALADYMVSLVEPRFHYTRGELELARPLAESSVRDYDFMPEPHLWLARIYDRSKRPDAALQEYRAYQSRLPDVQTAPVQNVAVVERIRQLESSQAPAGPSGGGTAGGGASAPGAPAGGPTELAEMHIVTGEGETYRPEATPEQREQAMQAAFREADRLTQANDHGQALERFYVSYHRSIPTADEIGAFAWNVGSEYGRLDDIQGRLFFRRLALAYYPETSDRAREARSEIAALRSKLRGHTLPGAVEQIVQVSDADLRRYGQALMRAREAYVQENFQDTIARAMEASQILPLLSEPFLWIARAHDRMGHNREALQNYLACDERAGKEAGHHIVSIVQVRISQLRGGPAPGAAGGAPGGQPRGGASEGLTGSETSGAPRSPEAPSGGTSGEAAPAAPAPTAGGQRAGRPGTSGAEAAPSSAGSTAGGAQSPSERRSGGGAGTSGAPASVELRISYVYRRIKQSGQYEVDLRQRLREDRELTMAGNIGGFIKSQADINRYLVTVNLDDPFFQDRTVQVILDGQDYEDLKNYVNSVSVQFRRTHEDGTMTEGDVKFFADQFAAQGNRVSWIYPRLGDSPEQWLNYEYKVVWQFYGGAHTETAWTKTDLSVLTLSTPVKYRTLRINLDQRNLADRAVMAVTVQFRSKLYGVSTTHEIFVDYLGGDPLQAQYRYLQMANDNFYEMKVIWTMQDGREVTQDWAKREGTIVPLRLVR